MRNSRVFFFCSSDSTHWTENVVVVDGRWIREDRASWFVPARGFLFLKQYSSEYYCTVCLSRPGRPLTRGQTAVSPCAQFLYAVLTVSIPRPLKQILYTLFVLVARFWACVVLP